MNRHDATRALDRAAQISRELAKIADTGDVETTRRLDAERMQLLKSVRVNGQPLSEADKVTLREIAELNDRAIGFLEHRRRCKARDLDMLSVGKRALRAYSAIERYR